MVLSSGSLEALRWLALLLVTLDYVNKHLLHASVPELFAAGRLALPLFSFVLCCNLARPGALASGGYSRTARRLAIFGTIATIPFIALGDLGWGWGPFNIMATLLVATLCAWLIEAGGPARLVAAAAVFIFRRRAGRVLVARARGLPAGLGLLPTAHLVDAGAVGQRSRLPVRHQPQPVGARRVAADLRSGTVQAERATREAWFLLLLPDAPGGALGSGATAVAAFPADAACAFKRAAQQRTTRQ